MLYAKIFFSSQTLDSILKSDHLATLTLIGETVKNKKEALKKIMFDKTNYSKKMLKRKIGDHFIYQKNLKSCIKNFARHWKR